MNALDSRKIDMAPKIMAALNSRFDNQYYIHRWLDAFNDELEMTPRDAYRSGRLDELLSVITKRTIE